MVDNIRHSSSAPEAGCDCMMAAFNGTRPLLLRPKRLKLRRIRSSSSITSEPDSQIFTSGERNLSKRKRNVHLYNNEPVTSTSSKKPESDVIVAGTSSCLGGGGDEGNIKMVTCLSHGSMSVIGRRREMEDAVAIVEGFTIKGRKKYDFFGIYDGHGGARVAQACRERLHEVIIQQLEEGVDDNGGVVDWEKVMVSSFNKMDLEVNTNGGSAVATMGSTAIVAVVGGEELVVANCGDSRAVLFQDGAPVALSDDHKPDRADELERIEVCGGRVINWNGHRVLGVLATSRSIGDNYLKPFVISEPEVRVMKKSDKDEFLILGSDGLWDVIANDLACDIVRRCLDGHKRRASSYKDENNSRRGSKKTETGAALAATLLAELAIARGSRDNISVVVVEL